MNKRRGYTQIILQLVLAGFCLYGTMGFAGNLDRVNGAIAVFPGFRVIAILVVISIVGFGVVLGISFLRLIAVAHWLRACMLVFACCFLLIQILLTIAPEISACGCLTLAETISSILDWSRVEMALAFLVVGAVMFFLPHEKPDEIQQPQGPPLEPAA